MSTPDPAVPDAEAWSLHLELPSGRTFTSAELYPVTMGVEPEHGAKPEPFFWDSEDESWWSLSPLSERAVSALVWSVDLVQLGFHPEETRRPFLEGVLGELSRRAKAIGGAVRTNETISEALLRLPKVVERNELRNATVAVVLVPPEPALVRAWWEALEGAGMHVGDGDMFWIDAEDLGFGEEYFEICAEPLSSGGYFHPGDLDGSTTFPDVTLSFRIAEAEQPEAVVPALVALAEEVAAPLGARLEAPDGGPWSKARAMAWIMRVRSALGPNA